MYVSGNRVHEGKVEVASKEIIKIWYIDGFRPAIIITTVYALNIYCRTLQDTLQHITESEKSTGKHKAAVTNV